MDTNECIHFCGSCSNSFSDIIKHEGFISKQELVEKAKKYDILVEKADQAIVERRYSEEFDEQDARDMVMVNMAASTAIKSLLNPSEEKESV